MLNKEIVNPKSIVVVGGSDDVTKPGGKIIKNIVDNNFAGELFIVNPKNDIIQGIKTHNTVEQLPQVDMAVLAIASKYCLHAVEVLAREKSTKAFIIISAAFSEESHEGAEIEKAIVDVINSVGGCLIGPNCVGAITNHHAACFSTPVPSLDPMGVDFVTGSGATAVFIMEYGMQNGLLFSSLYSVGNSAQMGVEEVIKSLDEEYVHGKSAPVKMLYMESVKKPEMLLKHASSLIRKGAKICAIKSGTSDAGSRAATSHTGAIASPDIAVDALFKKAGIVRCYSRSELVNVASVMCQRELNGRNIAIITHAGGPAVMLTDVLSNGGMNIPKIEGEKAQELLTKLYGGSSVSNPIDFLATGTAEQLGDIIDACNNDFESIDAMVVIFGSPGLTQIDDVLEMLDKKLKTTKKPIYMVLPSVVNTKRELEEFRNKKHIFFNDESVFGNALCKVANAPKPQSNDQTIFIDTETIRKVVDSNSDGYLSAKDVNTLLVAAGVPVVQETVTDNIEIAVQSAEKMGYPIVMKVVGPVHKSDVGGVVLNVSNAQSVREHFERMIQIKDTTAIMLQQMISGKELFVGAKKEGDFGHLIMCGMGGIFIEVLKDVAVGIAPLAENECNTMIKSLKSYKIIKGVRGEKPLDEAKFREIVMRISALVQAAPEIIEMDLNPLLATSDSVIDVDARICLKK